MSAVVGRSVAPPLALLVALVTTSVVFYAGIAEAPKQLFGGGETLVVGPLGDEVPGRGNLSAALGPAALELPGVRAVSPEVFVLTTLRGRSVMARGVEFPAFLGMEGGRLAEGRLPEASDETLLGAALAQTTGLRVGDRVLLPGSLVRSATALRVVGVADFPGAPRDNLLLPLSAARPLANLSEEQVHILRLATDEPGAVARIVESVGPQVRLSDVRLASTSLVAGEKAVVTLNVANWGADSGVRTIRVTDDGAVVAERVVDVPPRRVVPVRIEFPLAGEGVHDIQVNPRFEVEVRPPSFELRDLPPSAALGVPFSVVVATADGAPVAGVAVQAGDGPLVLTDARGAARLALRSLGAVQVRALLNGTTAAVAEIVGIAAAPGEAIGPRASVTRIDLLDEAVGTREPVRLAVAVRNVGDAAGEVEVEVVLDREPPVTLRASLAIGESAVVPLVVGPVEPGRHRVLAGDEGVEFKAYAGDDPALARLRDELASGGGESGFAPEDYVDRLLGNVSLAVLALSLASGALAAAGAVAVLARHLADRRDALATLRAVGADDRTIVAIATGEAARVGVVACAGGVAAGVVLAVALDRLHVLRAFGHSTHPSLGPGLVAAVFVVSLWVALLVCRATVRGALRAAR